jgi:signal transduction histidine kinase
MTILNDVLDFSKIEAGKLDLECIEFEVRAVLDGGARHIALTSISRSLSAREELAFAALLPKPIKQGELLDAILVSRRRQTSRAARGPRADTGPACEALG